MAPAGRRLLLALVLCCAACAARAQTDDDFFAEGAPGPDEIYMENVTPQAITFGLSYDNESWERFQLEPGGVAVLGGSDTWFFLILTEGVELRYQLDGAGSYRIYWNEVDLRWDLLTCELPACGRLETTTP